MYEAFFGLAKKPFELVPNPDFLYLSRTHNKVGIYLDYAMQENTGFILLTGEVGAGKTTIIRSLLGRLGPEVQVSKVFNTKLSSEELLATINDDFGLDAGGKSKVQLLKELYHFLIEQYGQGRRCVLIVDEAQNLSVDSLEELRLLSNLETNDAKLMQILLVGQPELKRVLSVPELRQLRQRISIHCHLQPLSCAETQEYILHRLEIAGNRGAVEFTPAAVGLIYEYSGGIPRLINVMCDFLLLSAYSEGSRSISETLVGEVAADPQFEGQFFPRRPGAAPVLPPALAEKEQKRAPAAPAPPPAAPPAPPAEEISGLHRQLDSLEDLVREVSQAVRPEAAAAGSADRSEADLVLSMPKFHSAPARKSGLLSGFCRHFLKSILP